MVICEHVYLYIEKYIGKYIGKDRYIIESLRKGTCEICNGFLLCKKKIIIIYN